MVLAEDGEACAGVVLVEPLAGHGEHAAGAGGGVVDGAYDAGGGEGVAVFCKDEVDHEADDFARGEVVAGCLVGLLGELADELFKDGAHGFVRDDVGVEIDLRELLGDEVEEVGLRQAGDLRGELEAVEDVFDVGGEAVEVASEVGGDVVLVVLDGFEVQGRGVVKGGAGGSDEVGIEGGGGVLALLSLLEDGLLLWSEDAVHTAKNGEGEDDLAVLVRFIGSAEEVRYGPDEGGKVHRTNVSRWGPVSEVPARRTGLGTYVVCSAGGRAHASNRRRVSADARVSKRSDLRPALVWFQWWRPGDRSTRNRNPNDFTMT